MLSNRKSRVLAAVFGGALLVATPAAAAQFRAILTGDNQLSAGDRDGWGRARIRVDDTLNTLCADLEVRSIGQVTSAQIFRGTAGTQGLPVANLDRPGRDDNDSEDCDNIGDALADEIQANPAAFYVEVKTTEYPNGAIRGQLGPSTG